MMVNKISIENGISMIVHSIIARVFVGDPELHRLQSHASVFQNTNRPLIDALWSSVCVRKKSVV